MKELKNPNKIQQIILTIFLIFAILCSITSLGLSIYLIKKQPIPTIPIQTSLSYQIYRDNNTLKMWDIKKELIDEIDKYIKQVAPTSIVDGNHLFNLCEQYNVDIIFVLAQGQKESHFATEGLGGKINNIFNVQVYDSCKKPSDVNINMRKKHPNESIEPYLKLLTTKYLVNGKTEVDLLKNFVNKDGHRYASSKTYEQDLLSIINNIKSNTRISTLYKEYINYQILSNY